MEILDPLEQPRFWTRLALAPIALSYGAYALALAGLARRPWIIALTLAAAAAAAWFTRPTWRRPGVAWLPFLPLLAIYEAHAWGPEFQPDAAGYHLGLAAEWLRDGRLPGRIGFYEVLPQGMEMLFGAAMSLGGSIAARILHLGFLAGCAGLLMRLGAQPPAALIFFAIPVAAVSGASAYTDAAQVFFLLAAFALLEEERPFMAGLCAGFVYAVKISGLIALPAGLLWLIWKRRSRSLLPFAVGALLTIAPWMARAVWLTGNPLAPLANGLFPNDAFHPGTDASFLQSVHSSLPWWKLPWAVAVDGFAAQGLLGPCFLLVAPLALVAIKRERGRIWLAAAAIFLVPWLVNPGARFALPAAAFLCLALSEALPPRALWALASVHALLSLPPVMDLYAHPQAWRLREWRYELPESWFAPTRMVNRHVKPGERVLDLVGLPSLYLDSVPIGPASCVEVDQFTDTLYRGTGTPPPKFELSAEWPMRFVRALRVRAGSPPSSIPWSVTEIKPMRAGHPVSALANWFVDAWPVPADAALAADGNPASRWQSWLPAPKGAFVELRFDRPVPLDGARVLLENYQVQQDVRLYTQTAADRRWSEAPLRWRQLPPALPRRAAIAWLRSRGIRWIVAKDERGGFGEIGQALRMAPEAWGVTPVDRVDNLWLFRIGDAPPTP